VRAVWAVHNRIHGPVSLGKCGRCSLVILRQGTAAPWRDLEHSDRPSTMAPRSARTERSRARRGSTRTSLEVEGITTPASGRDLLPLPSSDRRSRTAVPAGGSRRRRWRACRSPSRCSFRSGHSGR